MDSPGGVIFLGGVEGDSSCLHLQEEFFGFTYYLRTVSPAEVMQSADTVPRVFRRGASVPPPNWSDSELLSFFSLFLGEKM